jgi:hypothetical protein
MAYFNLVKSDSAPKHLLIKDLKGRDIAPTLGTVKQLKKSLDLALFRYRDAIFGELHDKSIHVAA